MKPRRHLTSVDLLPTILELQESQSLDDYIDSIRELSQPTYPLSGPLRGSRLSPLRMARHPSMSLATTGSVLAHKPWALSGPDNVSLTLTDSKGPVSSNQDPLDWLFTQAQTDPEDVCMIWWRHKWWELTASGICCNNHKSCNGLFLFSAY